MNRQIYDIEVLPNLFMLVATPDGKTYHEFLVGEDRDDRVALHKFVEACDEMCGYNNLGYDYPVLHEVLELPLSASVEEFNRVAYRKSKDIVTTDFMDKNAKMKHILWEHDQKVKQMDLIMIWGFGEDRRNVSLKQLEFNMLKDDIVETPVDFDADIKGEDIDRLLKYCRFDVETTYEFYLESIHKIKLREEMGDRYGMYFQRCSDDAMGQKIMVANVEEAMGKGTCYSWEEDPETGKRTKITHKTKRNQIRLADCLLSMIHFESPEFNSILDFLNRKVITQTKGALIELDPKELGSVMNYCNQEKTKGKIKSLNTVFKGIKYVFGLGGLHACAEEGLYSSNDEFEIIDVDVESFYPSLAIVNGFYPEHLGPEFCRVYSDLKNERLKHKKGTSANLAIKLALNATFGNSLNPYSPFFDQKFGMSITLNGQLQLAMLVEQMHAEIADISVLQANTDGVTFKIPKGSVPEFMDVYDLWQKATKLKLEMVKYSNMLIRDVNNYIAVSVDGKVKSKGTYAHVRGKAEAGGLTWAQDHSALVVPKAAEANLMHGTPIEEFIREHAEDQDNRFDFYLRMKIARTHDLILVNPDGDVDYQQRITRYYVSTDGRPMVKCMPPMKKKMTKKLQGEWDALGVQWTKVELNRIVSHMATREMFDLEDIVDDRAESIDGDPAYEAAIELCQPTERLNDVHSGHLCTVANKAEELVNVDLQFYMNEVKKLLLNNVTLQNATEPEQYF